jgi:hypothetical protein
MRCKLTVSLLGVGFCGKEKPDGPEKKSNRSHARAFIISGLQPPPFSPSELTYWVTSSLMPHQYGHQRQKHTCNSIFHVLTSTMRAAIFLCLLASATSSPVHPSPSCMLNGNASLDASTTPLPHPCPLPIGWEVDWSVVNSTALISTDPDGFYPNNSWGW